MLHITNGDGAANIIQQTGIAGDVLPWRDPMHHGPFPDGYDRPALSRIRLAYLAGDADCDQLIEQNRLNDINQLTLDRLNDFAHRDALLASSEYEDIVLWFEHDLLDQLQLLQILDYFATNQYQCSLSLICINAFPDIDSFRGLGQLNPEQMATLWPSRKAVTQSQLTMATTIWSAFLNSNPTALLSAIQNQNNDLPFLNFAMRRYCQEFPWTLDGLSRTERQLVTLIRDGVDQPHQLFLQNMSAEEWLYIGDSRTFSQLKLLCEERQAVITCDGSATFCHPYEQKMELDEFIQQRFQLTDLGMQVLDGKVSLAGTRQYNAWLGGVHLNRGQSLWFWNDATGMFEDDVR